MTIPTQLNRITCTFLSIYFEGSSHLSNHITESGFVLPGDMVLGYANYGVQNHDIVGFAPSSRVGSCDITKRETRPHSSILVTLFATKFVPTDPLSPMLAQTHPRSSGHYVLASQARWDLAIENLDNKFEIPLMDCFHCRSKISVLLVIKEE